MPAVTIAERQAREKFLKICATTWGLQSCPPVVDCAFCARYGDTAYVRQFRNFVLAGFPPGILPQLLDPETTITTSDLDRHVKAQQWHKRRYQIRAMQITPDIVAELTLLRMAATAKFASGNSHDKGLELLAKIAGVGQEVHISGQVDHTWETLIKRQRTAGQDGVVITVDDDDFAQLPEDNLLEGPSAEAD